MGMKSRSGGEGAEKTKGMRTLNCPVETSKVEIKSVKRNKREKQEVIKKRARRMWVMFNLLRCEKTTRGTDAGTRGTKRERERKVGIRVIGKSAFPKREKPAPSTRSFAIRISLASSLDR